VNEQAEGEGEEAEASDIEPPVTARETLAEVAALRAVAAPMLAGADAELQPHIEAHLDIYAEVVEEVVFAHRRIADETDIEIGADTRWSAIWELTGRSLGVCRVVLHDLRGGFAGEMMGSIRGLHEATQLLAAVTYHREETLLRRWLRGDYVRPKKARAVMARKQAFALARMAEQCVEPVAGDIVTLGEEIYDLLSASAHHRRRSLGESISVPLRDFTYGPHPDANVRASYVVYAGHLIEETVMVIADGIGDIIGREYFHEVLPVLKAKMEAVREQHPLPADE
jgi:hypothetical protein